MQKTYCTYSQLVERENLASLALACRFPKYIIQPVGSYIPRDSTLTGCSVMLYICNTI